jgi:hypothetical protein
MMVNISRHSLVSADLVKAILKLIFATRVFAVGLIFVISCADDGRLLKQQTNSSPSEDDIRKLIASNPIYGACGLILFLELLHVCGWIDRRIPHIVKWWSYLASQISMIILLHNVCINSSNDPIKFFAIFFGTWSVVCSSAVFWATANAERKTHFRTPYTGLDNS